MSAFPVNGAMPVELTLNALAEGDELVGSTVGFSELLWAAVRLCVTVRVRVGRMVIVLGISAFPE